MFQPCFLYKNVILFIIIGDVHVSAIVFFLQTPAKQNKIPFVQFKDKLTFYMYLVPRCECTSNRDCPATAYCRDCECIPDVEGQICDPTEGCAQGKTREVEDLSVLTF